MIISGFTFIHNALVGGYPIVEAINAVRPYVDEIVVVDMQSTDKTRNLLRDLSVDKIIDGNWVEGGGDHNCLRKAHALNKECSGDIIVHFEADEVYDDNLIQFITNDLRTNPDSTLNYVLYRLQVSQNFQRCRWYPWPVHRVFPRGSAMKVGENTKEYKDKAIRYNLVSPEHGYLWDITFNFRDQLMNRIVQNGSLYGNVSYKLVPYHFAEPYVLNQEDVEKLLKGDHWTWKNTPFNIPDILRPLVGKTKYEPI